MSPLAAVLVCALDALGRSHANAPITLIPAPPPYASRNAEAFVTRDPDTIYLITSTEAFLDARQDPWTSAHRDGCRKIASIIVHEEWHLRYGADESGAYLAQLSFLQAQGARSPTLSSVRKSMMVAVAAQQANRRRLTARNGVGFR